MIFAVWMFSEVVGVSGKDWCILPPTAPTERIFNGW